MHSTILILTLAAVLALAGCEKNNVVFTTEPVDVPAATRAIGPRLSGGNGSPLILSWMEQDDSGGALLYSRYESGGWSEPAVVVDGVDMFVNWADMPAVQQTGDGTMLAFWLQKSADLTYAYDVVLVLSDDGGATWSEPVLPHTDGTPTEHGFVSVFEEGDRTGLIWLDGRKMVNEATGNPADTGMTLRGAFIGDDGSVDDKQVIDDLTCDCCQTDVALASSGPIAVYRDRTSDEIRDISVSRRIDGTWQPGVPVAADGWEIPGCPVNGPAIVAKDDFVAVAWFTAANNETRVKLAVSEDSGASFGPAEQEIVAGVGRVGLALLPDSSVALTWVQKGTEGQNQLWVKRNAPDGEAEVPFVVAHHIGMYSVPQVGVADDELVFVWTETEGTVNTIRSARAPADSL